MPEHQMTTMPNKPTGGTVLAQEDPDKPLFEGAGDHDYVCGDCGNLLANGIEEGQIQGVAVQCGACGAYNLFD